MRVITPLRMCRHKIEMTELTISDCVYLLGMRPELQQAGITEAIKRFSGQDSSQWSVQERTLAICHYLSGTSDNPDFNVGEAKFTDYLMPDTAYPSNLPLRLGELCGDDWSIQPLTGEYAEAIERLIYDNKLTADLFGWWVGAMAAQLCLAHHVKPEPNEVDAWLLNRCEIIKSYPESDFKQLLLMFIRGNSELDHYFKLDFGKHGIVFRPASEVRALPVARFQFISTVSEFSIRVFGGLAESSD